ncbi:MAG: HNH endonuclease [Salinibacterium sp.]|nr:MAG: HNH endonuclease [Salinibacterium sp.]
MNIAQDFWRYVEKLPNGCWRWMRSLNKGGYGQVYDEEGNNLAAHRVAWELVNGPIPRGLNVLHRCDHGWCVHAEPGGNGGCLFLGTHADNMRDMVSKRRSSIGERNGQSRLSAEQVRSIRCRAAGGCTQIALSRSFGISTRQVRNIISHQKWRSVT